MAYAPWGEKGQRIWVWAPRPRQFKHRPARPPRRPAPVPITITPVHQVFSSVYMPPAGTIARSVLYHYHTVEKR